MAVTQSLGLEAAFDTNAQTAPQQRSNIFGRLPGQMTGQMTGQQQLVGQQVIGAPAIEPGSTVTMTPGGGRTIISPTGKRTRYDANGMELPDAKFWANFGKVDVYLNDQGQEVQGFIPAFGVAIDTLRPVPGNSPRAAKTNALIASLQQQMALMKPGQEVVLPGDICGLRLQLRRVREEASEETTANLPTVDLGLASLLGLNG